jgi:hypothetical protein
VEPSTVQDANNNLYVPNMPLNAGQPNTIYIVKPELQWCTCGIWQDVLYPVGMVVLNLEVEGKGFLLCPSEFGASLLQI